MGMSNRVVLLGKLGEAYANIQPVLLFGRKLLFGKHAPLPNAAARGMLSMLLYVFAPRHAKCLGMFVLFCLFKENQWVAVAVHAYGSVLSVQSHPFERDGRRREGTREEERGGARLPLPFFLGHGEVVMFFMPGCLFRWEPFSVPSILLLLLLGKLSLHKATREGCSRV